MYGFTGYATTCLAHIMQHATDATKNGDLIIKWPRELTFPTTPMQSTTIHSLIKRSERLSLANGKPQMGGSSFSQGLWEGLLDGVPNAHRIFVGSPLFSGAHSRGLVFFNFCAPKFSVTWLQFSKAHLLLPTAQTRVTFPAGKTQKLIELPSRPKAIFSLFKSTSALHPNLIPLTLCC